MSNNFNQASELKRADIDEASGSHLPLPKPDQPDLTGCATQGRAGGSHPTRKRGTQCR
jgi:hypothetical protein